MKVARGSSQAPLHADLPLRDPLWQSVSRHTHDRSFCRIQLYKNVKEGCPRTKPERGEGLKPVTPRVDSPLRYLVARLVWQSVRDTRPINRAA